MVAKWYLILVIVTRLADGTVQGQPTCHGKLLSTDCECNRDKDHTTFYDCDCSNKEWTSVHKGFPKQLSHLVLAKNLLAFLSNDSFLGCGRILVLDLSNNNLTSIAEGTFDEMTKLQNLFIDNNNLKFTDPSSVPEFMLRYNTQLEGIDMHNNSWCKEKYYNTELLKPLSRLRELKMDGIDGAVFDGNFKYLKNLTHFCLTGDIKHITNNTFQNFSELQNINTISIIGGYLASIDEWAFSHFPNLKKLDLTGNTELTFSGFQRSIHGLTVTNISHLTLTKIETEMMTITKEFFSQFRILKNLNDIHLDDNNIVEIDFANICNNIPHLTKLTVGLNIIKRVKNLNGLAKCKQFSTIFAQGQSNKVQSESFLQKEIALPPNVNHINLNNAFSISQIYSLTIKGGNKLQKVDLKFNDIMNMQGPVSFSPPCIPNESSGIHVDMSNNNLQFFHYNSFDSSISRCIRTLKLANNKLGEYIRQVDRLQFQNYENLAFLSLSTNGITTIQSDLFVMLRSLIRLRLVNNHLKSLFDITGFSPEYIYLSANDFKYLTFHDRSILDQSNNRRPLQVYMKKNPFDCTCESYPFLKWLITTSVNVTDWENSKCNGQAITPQTLASTILPHLFLRCHLKVWLIIGGSSFVGIVTLTVLIICLYRKRWCLKYWCIKAVRNQKRHQLLREHDTRDLYQYDAFVMYAADDSAWVAHNLVPNLESQESTGNENEDALKLCIHQRDFLGGVDISENIVQAIDSSFKCLVIRSRKFCQSEWTNFEIQMARTRSNTEGRNVIIVIRLEEVPLGEMSTSLIYVLQNHTYIDYPENEEVLPGFWEKVKNAIHESC